MSSFAILYTIIVHLLFTNQILLATMGKYSKEFKSMKYGSSYIFKSFLVVLFIISIVHMSESNIESDVSEATNLIETENLQSSEEKTEEPVKVINQLAYLQASDDDDSEQQNDVSYLVAETAGKTKMLHNEGTIIRMLRGNRMLKQPIALQQDDQSNGQSNKMYLVEHQNEIERIRSYLPNLMKLKKLVKKCQCSYRDEDEYSSIKDMMPNHVDHRVNLDCVDSDDEPDDDDRDDDRDDDEDGQYSNVMRQRNFNYNKYKRFDLNNFRDDEDMETENEDFETIPRFNEVREEEEKSLDEFQDSPDDSSSGEDESVDEEEFDFNEDNNSKDDEDQTNVKDLNKSNDSEQNDKLLSPFMTNLSPTSSSDLIFNNFNNEMSAMNSNTLQADQSDNESNEIQLAKLKRIITDGAVITNDSDYLKEANEIADSVEDAIPLYEQYSSLSSGRNSRRGGSSNGRKRNIFDWILVRKKRETNRGKSQMETKRSRSNKN